MSLRKHIQGLTKRMKKVTPFFETKKRINCYFYWETEEKEQKRTKKTRHADHLSPQRSKKVYSLNYMLLLFEVYISDKVM